MEKKQHITIFTTASLPWLTGTAVNPLFRAAYLSKDGERDVTLVIPWLSLKGQQLVYPNNITFASPSEQEKYIRQWLEERIGFASNFSIRFYPGKVIISLTVFIFSFNWNNCKRTQKNNNNTMTYARAREDHGLLLAIMKKCYFS